MKTIAVLGANGRVGREVAGAFSQAGYRVVTVTRYANPVPGLEQVTHRQADAMDKAALMLACHDADFVFNGLNAPYPQWAKAWPVMATNVLAACDASNAVHLFPGNVYGYGKDMPRVVSEQTPLLAQGEKGKIRNTIESQFESEKNKVQTIILRSGDYFGGTQTGSWFDLVLAKDMPKNKFVYPGSFDCMHAWAYLPDLARTFVKLANQADRCERFESFCFEGHSITARQMHCAVSQAADRPIALKAVNWSLYRALGLFIPVLREVRKIKYLWFAPHKLDGTKLANRVGMIPKTPLNQAIYQALTDLGIKVQPGAVTSLSGQPL